MHDAAGRASRGVIRSPSHRTILLPPPQCTFCLQSTDQPTNPRESRGTVGRTTTTTTTSPRTATEQNREDNPFRLGKVRENCSSTSNLLKPRAARHARHVHLLTHARLWAAPCKGASRVDSTFFTLKEREQSSNAPAPSRRPTIAMPTISSNPQPIHTLLFLL